MKLTTNAIERLASTKTKTKIAMDIDVSMNTFYRWVKSGHDNLTRKNTIQAIVKHTGLKESEIFEK